MTRFLNAKTATVGMMLGVFLACAPLALGDDSTEKPREVISTFAVTGMV